jgi:hypothetical protein
MGEGHNASLNPIKTNRLYLCLGVCSPFVRSGLGASIRPGGAARETLLEVLMRCPAVTSCWAAWIGWRAAAWAIVSGLFICSPFVTAGLGASIRPCTTALVARCGAPTAIVLATDLPQRFESGLLSAVDESAGPGAPPSCPPSRFCTVSFAVADAGPSADRQRETQVSGVQALCRPRALAAPGRDRPYSSAPRSSMSALSRFLFVRRKTVSYLTHRRLDDGRPNAGLRVSSCDSVFLNATPECGPEAPSGSPLRPVGEGDCAGAGGPPAHRRYPTVVCFLEVDRQGPSNFVVRKV